MSNKTDPCQKKSCTLVKVLFCTNQKKKTKERMRSGQKKKTIKINRTFSFYRQRENKNQEPKQLFFFFSPDFYQSSSINKTVPPLLFCSLNIQSIQCQKEKGRSY